MSNMQKTAKIKTGKAGVIVWVSVTTFLVILLIVVSILANTLLYPVLTSTLGGRRPILGDNVEQIYTSDYNSKNEVVEAGRDLNIRIEQEGAVLLLNENNALPVARGSNVSVFGKNSANLVLGGTGSGGGSGEGAATLFDGLEAGGINYNPTLREFYESGASGEGRTQTTLTESTSSYPELTTGETPLSSYTSEVMGSLRDYSDAAIVVISRVGGESFDLPRSQSGDGAIEGNHYLQLDSNEYALLDMVTSRFDKVIILLNTLQAFQCDFIEEYNNTPSDPRIDAVMWIGGPGATGAEAIGSLLNGEVNPSGRTVDIWARDFRNDPTWFNSGDGSQTTEDGSAATAFTENGEDVAGYNMVSYEEGVYMGYRYYETRDYEERRADSSSQWYERNVIFPFGYGLSYTTFDQQFVGQPEGEFTAQNGSVTFTVEVENTGSAAGKDAVQLYVTKPYTYGGIEKSYVELVDFAKTDILAPSGESGSTQTVTFTVNAYDLASYDYAGLNDIEGTGYELEAGDYVFYISSNSHVDGSAYDSVTVTLGQDISFENDPVTNTPVVNRYTIENSYDDIQYRLSDVEVETESGVVTRKGMSRTDFEGTFPTAPTVDDRAFREDDWGGQTERGSLDSREHNNTSITDVTEIPTMGDVEGSELMLRDLLENGRVDFNNPRWDELLNKLTFDELLDLVNHGAFLTVAVESIGKNLTNDSDGPIGFVNFQPGAVSEIFADNPTFAVEIVIGSTWNKDLAYQMGQIVGESGLWGDQSGNNGLPYSGWYAPAVNLHRSPFSGRNFEYYSEDPVISGQLAVSVINGAQTKGVYTDLKHFAVNDQETNRSNVSTFLTEQALREIYLKPFEIAVKGEGDISHVPSAQEDGITSFRGTTGIMSSFNRIGNKWTGGDYRLLTEILRNEWGYQGLVICDYKTNNSLMDSRQMLYAGNDLILTSLSSCYWNDASDSSAQDVTILRTAAKNILYTVANSNSIQMEILGYRTEWWITAIIVIDCVVPVALAVWGFFAIRRYIKNKKRVE